MKKNAKGRSSGGPPFVQLHHYMLDCAAWASLTAHEKAVYVAVCRVYNGSNNGRIGLGVRRGAQMAGINKDTVGRCFRTLIERGFVECSSPGGFNTNAAKAAEWRLTAFRCDVTKAPGSKAFMAWRPEKTEARPKTRTPPSDRFGQRPVELAPSVRPLRTGTAD